MIVKVQTKSNSVLFARKQQKIQLSQLTATSQNNKLHHVAKALTTCFFS